MELLSGVLYVLTDTLSRHLHSLPVWFYYSVTCNAFVDLIVLFQELWSLLEFMMPDLFATQEHVDLKKLLNAEDRDLVARMKSILGPFILRRLKSDVMQQLVPKIQRVCYILSYLI